LGDNLRRHAGEKQSQSHGMSPPSPNTDTCAGLATGRGMLENTPPGGQGILHVMVPSMLRGGAGHRACRRDRPLVCCDDLISGWVPLAFRPCKPQWRNDLQHREDANGTPIVHFRGTLIPSCHTALKLPRMRRLVRRPCLSSVNRPSRRHYTAKTLTAATAISALAAVAHRC